MSSRILILLLILSVSCGCALPRVRSATNHVRDPALDGIAAVSKSQAVFDARDSSLTVRTNLAHALRAANAAIDALCIKLIMLRDISPLDSPEQMDSVGTCVRLLAKEVLEANSDEHGKLVVSGISSLEGNWRSATMNARFFQNHRKNISFDEIPYKIMTPVEQAWFLTLRAQLQAIVADAVTARLRKQVGRSAETTREQKR